MALQKWMPGWGKLASWEPFSDLMDIQQEMNRLFDAFFGKASTKEALTEGGKWAPILDIYETKDELVVRAEVPGIDMKDLSITVTGDTLILKGKRSQEQEVKEENYYRMERHFGSFTRTLNLPTKVESDKVKAAYKDGVLDIRMPKKEEVKPKEIKIEEAA